MPQQRVDVVAKRRRTSAQPLLQAPELSDAEVQRIRAGEHPRALLSMAHVAIYLDIRGPRAADQTRQLLQREHVRLLRVGREYRVRQGDVDQMLERRAAGRSAIDDRAQALAARLHRRPAMSTIAPAAREA